jgi:hypothetical protein
MTTEAAEGAAATGRADEASFRAMARAILEPAGFEAFESDHARECLMQLRVGHATPLGKTRREVDSFNTFLSNVSCPRDASRARDATRGSTND